MTPQAPGDTLTVLLGRLQALRPAAHPLGLSAAEAEDAERQARSGGALAASLRAAPRGAVVERLLAAARPADPVAAVHGMVEVLGDAEVHERRLGAAAGYPAAVATAVAFAGVTVWGLALPATRHLVALPGAGAPGGGAWPWLLLLLTVAALASLSLALLGRVRLPFTRRALGALDGLRAWDAALSLHRAGAPLEAAVRASAEWLAGEARERRLRLAAALAAGGAWSEAGPESLQERLVAAGAQAGVGAAVLEALVAQARAELRGLVPTAAQRAQWAALGLGALAVLGVAAALFHEYTGALAGPGGLG